MIHKCWDCGGSGTKEIYKARYIDNGICYTCKGTGKTHKEQGEVSKAHKENQMKIAKQYETTKRIEKGEKLINKLALEISKKIEKNEEITEQLKTLTEYQNLLKALEQEKVNLEGSIIW